MLTVPVDAAVEPPVRAFRRPGGVVAAAVERRALVEHERDVRPQRGLDLHRRLRAHEVRRAVEVGAELHALFLDLQDRAGALAHELGLAALDLVGDGAVSHREDLEPAGVGDDRLVPLLELVQPAEALDELLAGRQEQMERVPEHHVVAEGGGLADFERLDDGLGRERDEGRGPDLAVGELERAGAGVGARISGADGKHGGGHVSRPRVVVTKRRPARSRSTWPRSSWPRSRSCAAWAARASGCAPRARRGRSSPRRPRG